MSVTSTSSTSSPRRPTLNKEVGLGLLTQLTIAEEFGLQGPEAYAYTANSKCLDVASINDSKDFQETIVSDPQRPF